MKTKTYPEKTQRVVMRDRTAAHSVILFLQSNTQTS